MQSHTRDTFEMFERHKVFLHFSNLVLAKKLSQNALAELYSAALNRENAERGHGSTCICMIHVCRDLDAVCRKIPCELF